MVRLAAWASGWALATCVLAGCGDPAVEDRDTAGANGDVGDPTGDMTGAGDGDGATSDAGTADGVADSGAVAGDVQDATVSDPTADATADDATTDDATVGDETASDAANEDGANEDASTTDDTADGAASQDGGAVDGGSVDPCGVCPWDTQPTGAHPGAKGPYGLLEPKTIAYSTAPFETYKQMLVFQPLVAGPHPVLLLVPGKQLYATGGIIGELGHAYRALCEHVASYGYVVAFVRVEQGLTDGDHARMAKDLLQAQAKLLSTITTADPTRLAYAGHSMGGKVVVVAAAEAIAGDANGVHVDPRVVVTMNLSNEAPPLGVYLDATKKVEELPADAKVWFTLIGAGDDSIAPVDASGKPNSKAVYDALKVPTRQLIVLHGTGKDDPNPATTPELVDDHSVPLTVNGKVGGLADLATPPSKLDALDWYGTWKLLVGAMGTVFQGLDSSWAYGDLRGHGGTLPDGTIVKHEVVGQGWTTLPAP